MSTKHALLRVWGLVVLGALCLTTVFAQQPVEKIIGTDFTKILPDTLKLIGTQDAPAQLLIKPGDKIAFMGDSITQFAGYVRLANYILNAQYPNLKPTFINAGVSGNVAEQMIVRFEKDMKLSEKPAVTFINVGINDVWHRLNKPHDPAVLDAYKANVAKMVDMAQAVGAQVVLLTPTVIQEDPKNEGNTRLTMYVDAMKQVAEEKKCKIIDLHAMFLSALAAKPAKIKLTVDGVHMATYGDAIMAAGVLRGLGVPDTVIAAVDVIPALQIRGWNISLVKAAAQLEVPADRFNKLEFQNFLAF